MALKPIILYSHLLAISSWGALHFSPWTLVSTTPTRTCLTCHKVKCTHLTSSSPVQPHTLPPFNSNKHGSDCRSKTQFALYSSTTPSWTRMETIPCIVCMCQWSLRQNRDKDHESYHGSIVQPRFH